MYKDRDKYLTETVGECWHERDFGKNRCNRCKDTLVYDEVGGIPLPNNFSTWEGFGKLWEWVSQQEWNYAFYTYATCTNSNTLTWWGAMTQHINPDKFADSLYEYLTKRSTSHE